MPPTSTTSPYNNKPDFDNRIIYQTIIKQICQQVRKCLHKN